MLLRQHLIAASVNGNKTPAQIWYWL